MNNTAKGPKWLDNAVFYEIYPQSFNDTNADGIGDKWYYGETRLHKRTWM